MNSWISLKSTKSVANRFDRFPSYLSVSTSQSPFIEAEVDWLTMFNDCSVQKYPTDHPLSHFRSKALNLRHHIGLYCWMMMGISVCKIGFLGDVMFEMIDEGVIGVNELNLGLFQRTSSDFSHLMCSYNALRFGNLWSANVFRSSFSGSIAISR